MSMDDAPTRRQVLQHATTGVLGALTAPVLAQSPHSDSMSASGPRQPVDPPTAAASAFARENADVAMIRAAWRQGVALPEDFRDEGVYAMFWITKATHNHESLELRK
jgi:hypothetical protein